MGEDSDPETGSNAVDDPRDDESEERRGTAPDDAVDRRSDGDDAEADAPSTSDSDGTATAAADENDSTVAQVDLDAGSAEGSDPATTEDAESRPSAASDPEAAEQYAPETAADDDSETSDRPTPADPDASDAAQDADGVDADTPETETPETGSADGDAAAGSDSPDESVPGDTVEPVADAVPDPGAPDGSPPGRAEAADAPDAADPVRPPAPAEPHPDASDDPVPDAPATDDTTDDHEPFPAADEVDATADAHAPEMGSEPDLAPVSEDSVDYDEFEDESYDVDDGIVGEGPAEDEEMPLADHIEEMIRRLGVVFLIGGVVLIAAFPVSDYIVNFLWNTHIPGASSPTSPRRPRLYGPLELILTELKVAGLAGFIAGLPALVYQSYRFMRPGLYPKERRYYLASVPTSLMLALVGVAFAHFIVLPAVFAYFTSYTANAEIVVAFGLRETFNLILLLMGYMALVFQIPLFMMLAIMMGLVTRQWMTDKRLLFWGAFLGLSFLVSPDPTGMTPIIVAATMIGLFEGTLLLIKWTGR